MYLRRGPRSAFSFYSNYSPSVPSATLYQRLLQGGTPNKFLPHSAVAPYSTYQRPRKRQKREPPDREMRGQHAHQHEGAKSGDLSQQNNSQEEVVFNSRDSWRPPQDRWKPKMPPRQDAVTTAPEDGPLPRRSKRLRDRPTQSSDTALNPEAAVYQSHPSEARSVNAAPLPFQFTAPNHQNPDLNQAYQGNNVNYGMFPPTLPSIYNDAFQQSSMELQNQLPPQLPFGPNPFLFNLFMSGLPTWNNMNDPSNLLPPTSPPGLMNFKMTNPMFGNLINGFPPFTPNFANATATSNPGASQDQGHRVSRPARLKNNITAPTSVRPAATEQYLAQASLPPQELSSPQPLLIILDINGTLIYRKHRRLPPSFTKRPGLNEFLDTLMDKYTVMIWSSSQPPTVRAVCDQLFPVETKRTALAAEWGRDKFNLTKAQYRDKVQVYKRLETVWADETIQARYPVSKSESGKQTGAQSLPKLRWDQSNTVLIDDSKLKALSEPYNILEVPEFTNGSGAGESLVFCKVLLRLEALAKCDDVSKMLRQWSSEKQDISRDIALELENQGDGLVHDNRPPLDQQGASSSAATPSAPLHPVEARKQRIKARKQEKKAARRAAANAAAAAMGPKQNAKAQKKAQAPPTASKGPSPPVPAPRSPSPVSTAGSENFLLDRLEESLDMNPR